MARMLSNGEVAALQTEGAVKKRHRYPWHKWANGEWWHLTQGEDFHGSITGFRGTAYGYARRHNLDVRTHAIRDGMVVRFIPKQETGTERGST